MILLGEMRDYATVSAAMTAAETGVLMLSTLHTVSAANTINRILDVFPANQQQQVKIQLAQTLRGIVCQQLLLGEDGKLIPAFEIMKVNPAIQNMIRDDKLHQLDSGHSGRRQRRGCAPWSEPLEAVPAGEDLQKHSAFQLHSL